jgi:pimeloyl-ACP methyl ester carboxylesterase
MNALMIHGAGGGAWEWHVWSRVFAAAGHAVTVPDLKPAASGLESTRWSDYLDQMQREAERLSAPRVLVGASLGGLLALAVAGRIECHALILINPLPPLPEALDLPGQEPAATIVPWAAEASLAGTRRAVPEADAASARFAFRRWRDEAGAVLNQARAGIPCDMPAGPVLVLASEADDDVPVALSQRLAQRLRASLCRTRGSHVAPLIGPEAATLAASAVQWLNGNPEFRGD